MTTFVAEAVVVSPSKTIVTHFKDATSTARVSSLKFDASNNAAPDENTFRAVEELLTARNSSDLDVSHHVLSRIEGSSRGVAWKYFLKVPTGTNEYLLACQAEQKPYDKKIRDDSFRTFKGDHEFWSRVKEDALVRVLNALSLEFGYVQGMNVLLGPFIYTLSEQESFHYMSTLLRNHIPRYVLKNLDGAHDGSKLFAKCLHLVDPKLYTHILSKIPDLSIFSLKYVLTLFANCKPLSEVIKLWDAVFAVGPHFNILLLCAKVMLVRDTILKEKRGAKIMQLLEETPVVSSTLIDGALCLMQHIPHELMRDLRSHALLSSTSASSAAPHLDSPQAGLKHFPSASTACTSGSASQHSSSANSHNSSSHSIDLHGGDGDGHEAAAADATTSSTAVKGIATVAAVAAVADCGVHLATPPRRSHPEKEKEQHVEQGQGAEDVGCWLKMSSTSTEKSGVTERSERSIVGELDN